MPDALDGLDDSERLACRVAERVTGATARAWDVKGRNGAVDAYLDYSDGRMGAFEVTRAATDESALKLNSLLGREGFKWALPGAWWWTVSVADVRDLCRARECFAKVVLLCENAGVCRPNFLFSTDIESLDEDLRWLVEDSSVILCGYPDIPAVEDGRRRWAMVSPDAPGGLVDDSLSGLHAVLEDALSGGHLLRHVEKLRRATGDERHLFIIVHESDLRFDVTSGLMFGRSVPAGLAWKPDGISHLWLAPVFSNRVLLSASSGWSQAFPYDE